LLSVQATAQEVRRDRTGFYLGLAGTFAVPTRLEDSLSRALPENIGTFYLDGVDVSASLGYHARGGYRLHPRLAVEAHFEDLAAFEIVAADGQRPSPEASTDLATLDGWTLTGDLKAFLLTGAVQPFGVVGAGLMRADAQRTASGALEEKVAQLVAEVPEGEAFTARLGGGVDIYLGSHFVVSIDATYVWPTAPIEDLRYVSFGWGFQYRF
jgi:hypothetical protein